MPRTTKDKGESTWTIISHGDPDTDMVSKALSELTYTLLLKESEESRMEILRKSLAAGVLIGLASGLFVSLSPLNRELAAFLFSFALFFICLLGLDLFTGKIGWLFRDGKPFWYYLAVLGGNLAGTFMASCILLAAMPHLRELAGEIIDAKSMSSLWQLFCKGTLCGIMMYLAVTCFKRKDGLLGYIGIFLAIPIFILAGYEHSIADAGYMFLAMRLEFFISLLLIVLGNALGSVLACFLMENAAHR